MRSMSVSQLASFPDVIRSFQHKSTPAQESKAAADLHIRLSRIVNSRAPVAFQQALLESNKQHDSGTRVQYHTVDTSGMSTSAP